MGILDWFFASPQDRFAGEVLRIARRMPGVARARYDRKDFAVVVERPAKGASVWIYLSNVYRECADASPAERHERIQRLVGVMATPPRDETWESARPRLRSVIRPATFGIGGMSGTVPPISRPAMPYLREFVVVDSPDSMAFVAPEHVEKWGVTVDDVLAAARANVAELARESFPGRPPVEDALIRMVDSGDSYFTSMLLVPGWLAEVSARMGGDVVAFVPDTKTVLLCGWPSAGIAPLYEVVEQEYGEAVRGLSPVGYVSNARGEVVPFVPPVDDAAYPLARRSEVVLAAIEYGAQANWLTAQYEQVGIDVYVGNVVAAAKEGYPPFTVATWTDGITSLLPEAMYIAFVREEGSGPTIPWSAVAELVDLRPEPLLFPARYRVTDWPSPEIMNKLLASAV